ncbi:hypothetical protein NPIL_220801 [Nephila pilipes]|uniref:Uncharacterized protein n=1 Tax=Nephila pilipes TaxID=299642 RepID=A0A8X6NI49_NEPPI|nr:hypothetical protein NPIL_220801 [Nephila pilipes]
MMFSNCPAETVRGVEAILRPDLSRTGGVYAVMPSHDSGLEGSDQTFDAAQMPGHEVDHFNLRGHLIQKPCVQLSGRTSHIKRNLR